MKNFTLSLLLSLSIASLSFAQKPKIQFEKNTHDFGTLKEEAGSVRYEFKFTNVGDAPLIISTVKASCGCTTPGWSNQPILPGKSGVVKAEYNPINRPGAFLKNLVVESNSVENQNLMLYIKGNVDPKARTPKDDYPEKIGSLRFKSRYFALNTVQRDKPVKRSFKVFNEGTKPVTFSDRVVAPPFIRFEYSPKTLEPGATGTITVEYESRLRNDYGYVQDQVILYTDEPDIEGKKQMVVAATIEDFFPPLTAEQYAQAPKLTLVKSFYDFGKLKSGDVVDTNFGIRNDGKQDLEIRHLKADCGCTVGTPEKKVLKPGETSSIKLTFNSKDRIGKQNKTLSIYSNDPKNHKQVITISSDVSE